MTPCPDILRPEPTVEQELTNEATIVLGSIAIMLLRGIMEHDVATAYDLTAEDWNSLRLTDEFQSVFAAKQRELLEEAKDIDASWNLIERASLERLETKIQVTHDPAVLLRMAQTANGARRKGRQIGQEALVEGSNAAKPATVNITLNAAFIQKMPSMDVEKEYVLIAHKEADKKQHDSLNTEVVTDLLENASQVADAQGRLAITGAKARELAMQSEDALEGWS